MVDSDDGTGSQSVQEYINALQAMLVFLMANNLDGPAAYRYLVRYTVCEVNTTAPFRVFSRFISKKRRHHVSFVIVALRRTYVLHNLFLS